jgi:hypothetical protein
MRIHKLLPHYRNLQYNRQKVAYKHMHFMKEYELVRMQGA